MSGPGKVLASQSCRVLHSWKEIAEYTGRGIRTLQRYEAHLGFPVHRPSSHNKSAVLAFTDEVDVWLKHTHVRALEIVRLGVAPSSAYLVLHLPDETGRDWPEQVCAVPVSGKEAFHLLLLHSQVPATGSPSTNGRAGEAAEGSRMASALSDGGRAQAVPLANCVMFQFGAHGSWHDAGEALAAAMDATNADFGNLQLLDSRIGKLKIVCQRGFHSEFLNFFSEVEPGESACGRAMQYRSRTVVQDVSESSCYNEYSREAMLKAGALACQSTPFFDRAGKLVGVLSTHYRTPKLPSPRALEQVDGLLRRISVMPRKSGRLVTDKRRLDERSGSRAIAAEECDV